MFGSLHIFTVLCLFYINITDITYVPHIHVPESDMELWKPQKMYSLPIGNSSSNRIPTEYHNFPQETTMWEDTSMGQRPS